jgi:hypothetical protein
MNSLLQRSIVVASIAVTFSLSGMASATTVTVVQNPANYTTLPTPGPNAAPDSYTLGGTVLLNIVGEFPDVYRSPFENSPYAPNAIGSPLSDGGLGITDWGTLPYNSIQAGGSATYDFAKGATQLSLLWGSPDSYNSLTFYSGVDGTGSALARVTGDQLLLQTYGHDMVDISLGGAVFESVILTSSSNAFEFAELKDAPATPLPATLPLFAGGLGLIVLYTRRKKRVQFARAIG